MSYASDKDRWQVRTVEWLLFAAAWSFRAITWPVPTWTLTRTMAPLGGWLAWMIPMASERILENLTHVWPGLTAEEEKVFVKANGRHTLSLMIEYARLDRFLREVAIEVEGEENLRDRPKGKGAILVTAHFGNWEAVRNAAKMLGHESGIIYRAFNNRYLDQFTLNLIPAAGEPVLQKGSGMRQLYAHIKKGGVVMILVDQRNTGAPYLDFLGRPAETVLAAAELAQRTGASLIPAVAYRDMEARRFRVSFEEPVTGSDPKAMMTEVNRRIGSWIEKAPDQWFWLHRRWRTTNRSRVLEEADIE
ncbi:lysophospholipid acyltransferase family protein [Rhodobacteraceae bacterium NNCM2]|nr:lysophospholipid acyltransferase family protein [Coraliihabitans acroporae]